jgi:hypothetical protein
MVEGTVENQAGRSLEKTGDGALERFIEAFNQYEACADLFDRCRDTEGFAWWDVVRYNVQYALCAEKGLYARPTNKTSNLFARGRRFVRQTVQLARDAIKIACLRRSGIAGIYVFLRRSEHLLEEIEHSERPCLIIDDTGSNRDSHVAISKRSVDFFIRLALRVANVPQAVALEAATLDGEIRRIFDSRLDIRQIILAKYRQHRASRFVWSCILAKLHDVARIGFVNDDTLKTLVHMANSRKITTREFQHGYMGTSHVGYSYPALSVPVTTLPAEVVVNWDTGDITYPVPVIRVKCPDTVAEMPSASVERDIDVLVGGSPTRVSETVLIVGALVNKGLQLAIKLHPSQTEASSGVRVHFTPDQVQIYPGEVDFRALARRSHVYVPANPTSTTVFEAVESGASLVVVDYGGRKLTGLVDRIVSGRVTSFQGLHEAVLPHLHRNIVPR